MKICKLLKDCKIYINVIQRCSQRKCVSCLIIFIAQNVHTKRLVKNKRIPLLFVFLTGDAQAGFSVFWADDGLDTGPLLLQRSVGVTLNDTVDSLYARFLFPEGVRGVVEAVQLIASGQAPRLVQPKEGATYDPMLNKLELQEVPLSSKRMTAVELHNFIRGLDKVPGAWLTIDGEPYRLYGSRLVLDRRFYELHETLVKSDPDRLEQGFGRRVSVQDDYAPSFITPHGLALFGIDGKAILVERLRGMAVGGRMLLASQLGSPNAPQALQLTEDELRLREKVRAVFADVLRLDSPDHVQDSTNFFDSGAGSMDVTRLAEELKELLGCNVENDDIYMDPEFSELFQRLAKRLREGLSAGGEALQIKYDGIEMEIRGKKIRFPSQPYINGEFVDVRAKAGTPREYSDIVNPANEKVICRVQKAGAFEVELAVNSAYNAFHQGKETWCSKKKRTTATIMMFVLDFQETGVR